MLNFDVDTSVWVCAAVLAVINYPFVLAVDRHVRTSQVKPVYGLKAPPAQSARERRNGLITTPVHAALLLGLSLVGALRTGNESIGMMALSFAAAFVWTEIWHYVSHRAMHWRPLHFIHVEHHRSRVTQPWTSVSFSLTEKFIFSAGILGALGVFSQWIALSAVGITAYYVLYFFTNTLGHANFEFRSPGYRATVLGKIFNSPTYHALHHARYTHNYGLMTPWLDQWFGTEWADAAAAQSRVASGHPLRTLRERVDATTGGR